MNKWYETSGKDADVVISSRVRLARNLSGFLFPIKLQGTAATEVINRVKSAILDDDKNFGQYKFRYINPNKCSKTELVSLVERHLVSPGFVANENERGIVLSEDEAISIMVNEEDHIRLQVMSQGFNLNATYETADSLDDLLDKKLGFSFDDKLGFLTQCPTNLGTGMRASLMLHLPGLRESGVIDKIVLNLSKLGLTMRGMYGEGTDSKGDIYQVSNQVTLGISEDASIKNLQNIATQIITQERNVRLEMMKRIETVDVIYRSLGVLRNARLLSSAEFMKLISNVRLGVASGEIKGISLDTIDYLIINTQPAMLKRQVGKELTATEREQLRADLIRQKLTIN